MYRRTTNTSHSLQVLLASAIIAVLALPSAAQDQAFFRVVSSNASRIIEFSFDGCEIDVQDEPVENPTMELFEGKGFRYTTYTLDPNGIMSPNCWPLDGEEG